MSRRRERVYRRRRVWHIVAKILIMSCIALYLPYIGVYSSSASWSVFILIQGSHHDIVYWKSVGLSRHGGDYVSTLIRYEMTYVLLSCFSCNLSDFL